MFLSSWKISMVRYTMSWTVSCPMRQSEAVLTSRVACWAWGPAKGPGAIPDGARGGVDIASPQSRRAPRPESARSGPISKCGRDFRPPRRQTSRHASRPEAAHSLRPGSRPVGRRVERRVEKPLRSRVRSSAAGRALGGGRAFPARSVFVRLSLVLLVRLLLVLGT